MLCREAVLKPPRRLPAVPVMRARRRRHRSGCCSSPCMSRPRWPALGAIGLAVSTLTEHSIGAIATVMILVAASEVVDNGPQLAALGP